MARIVVRFKEEKDGYCNLEAESFDECDGFYRAYGQHNELIGVFATDCVRMMYKTENK